VATGELVRSYAGHAGGVSRVLFTAGDRELVAAGGSFEPAIIVYSTAKARELRRLNGHTGYIDSIARAGKTLASVAQDDTLYVWDLANGKELRRWKCAAEILRADHVAFAADGTDLLAVDPAGDVCLFDVATGRVRRRVAVGRRWLGTSADGRTIAVATDNQTLELIEVATGAQRCVFKPPGALAWAIFSPDGRRLVTDGGNGAAWLWDLTGGVKAGLAAVELADRWRDLAGADSGSANWALWKLALSPQESLPLLREQLRPAVLASAGLTMRAIADLNDDDFAVRQKATQDLEVVGEGARNALEKALLEPASLEAKRRIEALLARLDAGPPAAKLLRELRALEVLEAIGTPEARKIVETVARGAPGMRLTREAQGTLDRFRP
jgi:hypothetical protein